MYTTLTQKALTVLVAGTMLGGTTFGMLAPAVAAPSNAEVSVTAVKAINASAELDSFQQEILELTNDYREKKDVAPVAWNKDIATVAQDWATAQAGSADFVANPEYSSTIPAGWTVSAENIGVGKNAKEVFKSWVKSPAHSASLLKADFTDFGVGYAVDTDEESDTYGQIFIVQDFASYPKNVEAPVVDENAEYSTDIAVDAPEKPVVGDAFAFTGENWAPGSILDVTVTSNDHIPATISYAVAADGSFGFDVKAFEAGSLDVAVSYDVDGEAETFETGFTVEKKAEPAPAEQAPVEEVPVKETPVVETPAPKAPAKAKEVAKTQVVTQKTVGAAALPQQPLVPEAEPTSDALGPGDEVDRGADNPDTTTPGDIDAPPTEVTGPGVDESGENFESNVATFYPTCDDAVAAGVAPIDRASSPDLYEANTRLDRDNDGVACDDETAGSGDAEVEPIVTEDATTEGEGENLADTGSNLGGVLSAGGLMMAIGAFLARRSLATARQNA